MNPKNMWECIRLDSFDATISFSTPQKHMISFLQEKNVLFEKPTEKQIVFKSKMFSLDILFYVSLRFKEDKLIAITMSPNTALEGKPLYCRYNKIQAALQNQLGFPHNSLRLIMNLLDPDNSLASWRRKEVRIKHYLLNRFGMEEIISIDLQS